MPKAVKIIIGVGSIVLGLYCFTTSIPTGIILILSGIAWLVITLAIFPNLFVRKPPNQNNQNSTYFPSYQQNQQLSPAQYHQAPQNQYGYTQPGNAPQVQNVPYQNSTPFAQPQVLPTQNFPQPQVTLPVCTESYDCIPYHDGDDIKVYKYEQRLCVINSAENPYPYIAKTVSEEGRFIEFEQEPENEYDSNAVAVIMSGKRIGYVYKGNVQKMINDYIKKDYNVFGNISIFTPETITYFIGFFKPKETFERHEVSYKNQKFAEEFFEGDMLLVKYDDIEEKCIVESEYDPMAFVLPKRFEKYVDKDYGTVAEVGENCESLIFYN